MSQFERRDSTPSTSEICDAFLIHRTRPRLQSYPTLDANINSEKINIEFQPSNLIFSQLPGIRVAGAVRLFTNVQENLWQDRQLQMKISDNQLMHRGNQPRQRSLLQSWTLFSTSLR